MHHESLAEPCQWVGLGSIVLLFRINKYQLITGTYFHINRKKEKKMREGKKKYVVDKYKTGNKVACFQVYYYSITYSSVECFQYMLHCCCCFSCLISADNECVSLV